MDDKNKTYTYGCKQAILLKDLDISSLRKGIKEIEQEDLNKYKHYSDLDLPVDEKSFAKEELPHENDNFSDDSIEYDEVEPYSIGSLGLVSLSKSRRMASKPRPIRSLILSERKFDWMAAAILSDLKLLNKFERKGSFYQKKKFVIRKKRRFYVYK